MTSDELLIRHWIGEVIAERDACTDPDRRELLTLREHKLGGLLPPATGTLNIDMPEAGMN